jgi:hypothetical protein
MSDENKPAPEHCLIKQEMCHVFRKFLSPYKNKENINIYLLGNVIGG